MIETKILDYMKEYNQLKSEIFSYTADKLIQKQEN